MKLLIITQKVDVNDPVLGFMHGWIKAFSGRCERLSVVCLEKGKSNLPERVEVYSLGKEVGTRRLGRLTRLFSYVWSHRAEYDAVFVHMNQEYVLLCGLLWRLMGKRVYMWRNHHSGNMLTRVAVLFCHKAFCTSRYSYTAQFKKTCFMPVGIDMDLFKPSLSAGPQPSTTASRILFLGRVAPVKRPDVFVDALELLVKKSSADIYGDALPKDQVYLDGLKKRVSESAALSSRVSFFAGIPNAETVVVYQQHGVYVNLSSSGMYDKTIFEAMACGSLVLASNKNLEGVIDGRCVLGESEVNAEGVATKLEVLLALSEQERSNIVRRLVAVAGENSLQALVSRLFEEMGK